ncbi:hypothetical protein [Burkholderia gladioli]|uniref:Uncharacterized protein n=1 Tax=Burkholderia gladioli TaxID=28095 RepID=A0AB38U5Z2_BURGA|nr:hypothetical protein [Burkholderia gladioli]UWX68851.1 hypothetical protein NYZ96_11440 [Burkholderia gladioli]UWX75346.1 hypothetical protein NYZ96_35275 [Burkholderia gladioli]
MTTTNESGKPALVAELVEALRDMLSGWRYIRQSHGDLYGVGWDRAQNKAETALEKAAKSEPAEIKPADGAPAFPCMHEGSTRSDAPGMTLRDYFAAKAMNAQCGLNLSATEIAERAYKIADAMLKARG